MRLPDAAIRSRCTTVPPRRRRTTASLEFKKRGIEAIAIQADLTDERSAKGLVEQTLARFGRIDVLVNCAATWHKKRLEDTTAADVRQSFETNLLSTFLCSQQAGLAMVRQPEGGVIVLIGDWAIVRPYLNFAAYFASKGSIPTLTRTLAVELGTRNPAIRVNAILPGPVMLPTDLPEEERRHAIEATLVKREGRPEHIAQAVLFFVDNDFVTGVCLPVDGGRTVFAPDSADRRTAAKFPDLPISSPHEKLHARLGIRKLAATIGLPMNPESQRLDEARRHTQPWRRWGPYLSERQWGTVREDYSPTGDAWEYFPHEHARSRAYRWGEDGIAGICDRSSTSASLSLSGTAATRS